jgi:hypothetical protein
MRIYAKLFLAIYGLLLTLLYVKLSLDLTIFFATIHCKENTKT